MTVYVLMFRGFLIAAFESYGDAVRERNNFYPEGRILECNVRPENKNAEAYR